LSRFSEFEIKPEKFVWVGLGSVLTATTTRGIYIIKQKHYLSFRPSPVSPTIKLGRFTDPKRQARKHYNEEA